MSGNNDKPSNADAGDLINSPYDKLFKEVLSDKDNAADLITGVFPSDLTTLLKLPTLTLDNNSYINERLNESFSDIVYGCTLENTNIDIALLFEHKSYKEKFPKLQLLKYCINIWETQIKQHTPLTPVIVVVLYHGYGRFDERPIFDYFPAGTNGILHEFTPDMKCIAVNLADITDEQLQGTLFKQAMLSLMVWMFKNRSNPEMIFNNLGSKLSVFDFFADKDDKDKEKSLKNIVTLLKYVSTITGKTIKEIQQKITEEDSNGGQKAMTSFFEEFKEEMRAEGRAEGIATGRAEGRAENAQATAKAMVKEGISMHTISKITGLSAAEIEKL